jgi:hypothetical protein
MPEASAASVFDNADEFVSEGLLVVCVPVGGEVEGTVDGNRSVDFSAEVVRSLELNSQDVRSIGDELLSLLLSAAVLAGITAISLNCFDHILLKVLG